MRKNTSSEFMPADSTPRGQNKKITQEKKTGQGKQLPLRPVTIPGNSQENGKKHSGLDQPVKGVKAFQRINISETGGELQEPFSFKGENGYARA